MNPEHSDLGKPKNIVEEPKEVGDAASTMEALAEKRETVFKGVMGKLEGLLKSRMSGLQAELMSDTLNWVPVIANYKMAVEAFKGETLAGAKLSRTERYLYHSVALTGAIFYVVLLYELAKIPFGKSHETYHSIVTKAGSIATLHETLLLVVNGPKFIKDLKKAIGSESELTTFLMSEERILGNYGYQKATKLVEENPLPPKTDGGE